ncbi:homoserine dehydrogenase [Halocatena pleomorpha]|uniref:homoserine dehydrogenase n=1 Tax=Halocatena pleomorpha TaxID=1785090 RepID=A0A3P3RFY4_9EURY|nr:homoserine dehydrogenase [Halocatena pleomorpha]RRJ32321.1 homoserine dehydrogenase [Halocatena pleomorpha]
MKLAIMGAGAVGASVAELASTYGHEVTAIADSNSAAIDPTGLDTDAVLTSKRTSGAVGDDDPDAVLAGTYDVLVEATPTTLGDANPGYNHTVEALERDRHVVLANKGPIAERYDEIRTSERDSDGRVLFDATVGGAIPVLTTIGDLGRSNVTAVRGVLNGTANFILSRMAAESLDYEHVLAEAQDLGVAEADPTFDVDGTDAALKCVILANVLFDGGYALSDASVTGIREIPGTALQLAAEDGRTIRLIGEVIDDEICVEPRLVPETGTLAVSGTQNIVQLHTEHAGRLNISGRGAGGHETATAVLGDINRLS